MMMKKLLSLLLALCVLLGCAASFAEEAEEEADVVMAYVNGKPIMLSVVDSYFEELANEQELESDLTEDATRALYEQALHLAMGYELMEQKAEEMGLMILTEEEEAQLAQQVSQEWEEAVDLYAQYYFGASAEADEATNAQARVSALAFLESLGYTEETVLNGYREQAWYDKLVAEMCKNVSVTEQDAYDYFLALAEQDKEYMDDDAMFYEYFTTYYGYEFYYVPEGFRGVKQILLEVDEELLAAWSELNDAWEAQEGAEGEVTMDMVLEAEAAVLASVQDKIDDIQTRLAASEPFDSLIAEYNADPGMTQEPYATEGYSVHTDSILWDPAFVAAAFSVNEIGQVSAPTLGAYGIYIVQYLRDLPGGPVAYTDEIKAHVTAQLQQELESGVVNDTVNRWLDEADVIVTLAAEDFLPYPEAETEPAQ